MDLFWMYHPFFTVVTCKVEAYRVQREIVISVCKFLFWILFAPVHFYFTFRNSEEGGWYNQNWSMEA